MRFDPLRIRAEFAHRSGVMARHLRKLPGGLYVFNFHRIGDPRSTKFDPNIFSCSADALEKHIKQLKLHFDLIDPAKLDEVADARAGDRVALLTFDDGYRDNHTEALPVLLAQNAQAIFFICTGFIDQDTPPWWDRVAFMVRHSNVESILLNDKSIAIRGKPTNIAIRDVLREFKLIEEKASEKTEKLRALLKPTEPLPGDSLFMSWEDVVDLAAQGMTIGSHSLNHDKLSHVPPEEQLTELRESKRILDERLNQNTRFLAYPVGGFDSFTYRTVQIAADLGYEYAFTTEQHVNQADKWSSLAMGRFSVSSEQAQVSHYMMLRHISNNLR